MPDLIAAAAAGAQLEHGLLMSLFVIFVAAKILAEIFERLHQPAVVGEIIAGILIGPSVFNWVQPSVTTATLAEIGVILLMFSVGLETEPRAILSVGKSAVKVAVLGVVFPFVLGAAAVFLGAPLLGLSAPMVPALFVGAAMVATSVGITARVLADMNLLSHQSARIILAAAVIDDVLALLVLATVSGVASGSGINWLQVGVTAAMALTFVVFITLAGTRIINYAAPKIERLHTHNPLFIAALALCLGLAWLSESIGIAAIIGAFLAGMVLADRSDQEHLLHKTEALVHMWLPFFLVNIGMQLNISVFKNGMVIAAAVVITILAVIGKYYGGILGARDLGKRSARQIGMGMVPRGEVGIVAAQMGIAMGALDENLYAVVLFMAVATTLLAPPFLRRFFAGEEELPVAEGSTPQEPVVEDQPFRVH